MIQSPKITFARSLRKNQTDAEKLLWTRLRNRRLDGIKFRRQQQIAHYIVDFVSFEKKLIIEVDGSGHNTDLGRRSDTIRTQFLEEKRYKILRFWNNEVIRELDTVMEVIHKAITTPHPVIY